MNLKDALLSGELVSPSEEYDPWEDATDYNDLLNADRDFLLRRLDWTPWNYIPIADDHKSSIKKLVQLVEYGLLTFDGQSGKCSNVLIKDEHNELTKDDPKFVVRNEMISETQRGYINGFMPKSYPLEMYYEIAKQGVTVVMTTMFTGLTDEELSEYEENIDRLYPLVFMLNAPLRQQNENTSILVPLTCWNHVNFPNGTFCGTNFNLDLLVQQSFNDLSVLKPSLRSKLTSKAVWVLFIRIGWCKQDLEDIILQSVKKYGRKILTNKKRKR